MEESTPHSPVTASGRGFVGRVFRRLLAPVRYARRRPFRALAWALAFLAALIAAAAIALLIVFEYHLRAARAELERGHNAPLPSTSNGAGGPPLRRSPSSARPRALGSWTKPMRF